MTQKGSTNRSGTMNCWNLTYNDPGRWEEVYAICGRPISFLKGIMQGGTGSPRGVLIDVPGESASQLLETSNIKYCNFQRTEKGAILFFKVRLEVYGIPIRETDVVSIRLEHRKSNAFQHAIILMLGTGKQIEIACQQDKQGAWEKFLKSCFVRL